MDPVRSHDSQAVFIAGNRVSFGHLEAVVHVDDGLQEKNQLFIEIKKQDLEGACCHVYSNVEIRKANANNGTNLNNRC